MGFEDILLSNPQLWILVLSFLINLGIVLITKFTTDQKKLKDIKEEVKALRQEMKDNKDNPEKVVEIQKKLTSKSFEPMKHTLKPMLITFLPLVLLWYWLRSVIPYEQIILNFPFEIPKPGANDGMGWLGVYILSSLLFSTVLKKIFKVH
jgi:uncharacterized membrane protein (DUF106 family)